MVSNGYERNHFSEDNDPKHTARITQEWLETNSIEVLDWPSQSPDLNPIEHLWAEVARRLEDLRRDIKNKNDLWEKLQDVWNGVELEFCTKLINTMPMRILDVLKAKGGYTKW